MHHSDVHDHHAHPPFGGETTAIEQDGMVELTMVRIVQSRPLHNLDGKPLKPPIRISDDPGQVQQPWEQPNDYQVPVDQPSAPTGGSFHPDNESDGSRSVDANDGIHYPGHVKLTFITLALCLAVFLVALVWQF
jgi:hypothetical protein